MAQVVFSEVGAALGRKFLPQGLSLLGRTIGGAALGRAAGAALGGAIDAHFAAPMEGPRISELALMGAAEGAGIASVSGRMRVGGHLIWASRFTERRRKERTGGKGGPRVETLRYSVSLAVALGEGPVQRITRAWANGEPFDLSGVMHRFYPGTEDQLPDPLIEMIEGAAPAYRGIAYVVFEDLPLEAFGNRIPQLSFEVLRGPPEPDGGSLAATVTGVNIIPASGEFVYATEIVREQLGPGRERALNVHSGEARADFLVSLDQMRDDLPGVTHVALTVGWFGSSLLAGECAIRPGVETRTRVTVPRAWSVDGETRAGAYLVSQDEAGRANYGGTPSDDSVVAALCELKERGYQVTLTPFLFMDSEGFPWRGRITVSADGTNAARSEIAAFMEDYRRFILHHAALAAEAGGVEAFLIGSEMRGLTRVRDEAGAFPFVEALCTLAEEVRAVLPDAKISYAADWTEYGAFVPGDGSGDVLFPLDALWAHPDVDFVGIDWYPPMGDWRDGADHLDALAGYRAADDADYLAAQLEGGEAYDWYYADAEARAAQVRTPIIDTAHGEHWVFRQKDLAGWAGAYHYPRPGGVRSETPTGWAPGLKPVRLSEIGFAAVDKAGNAPNLFYDPKSSESGLPPFSNGGRDDVAQRRLLAAALGHFGSVAHVWAWDARPFPAWPVRLDVWGDGGNWARGHWLNGRSGLAPLSAVVADICDAGGVAPVDVSGLDGVVEGYVRTGVSSVRAALEPLAAAYGFEAVERGGTLVFRMAGEELVHEVAAKAVNLDELRQTRQLMDKAPERLRLTCIDPLADHAPMVVEARRGTGDARLVADVALPIAVSAGRAEAIAAHLLASMTEARGAEVSGGLELAALETGDLVRFGGGDEVWRIEAITDRGVARHLLLSADAGALGRVRFGEPGRAPEASPVYPQADLVVMDAPTPAGDQAGPLVAAFSEPWPGAMAVRAGAAVDALSLRVVLDQPAVIARLAEPLGAGLAGRWDKARAVTVTAPGGAFESLTEAAVLAGGNSALLETEAGWELVQFREAELVAPETWRLSGWLRGQGGSVSEAAEAGARLVVLDGAVRVADLTSLETGLELLWKAGDGAAEAERFDNRAGLPWQPCQLRVRGGAASWIRRGREIADSWSFPEAPNEGRFAAEFDTGSGFEGRIEVEVPGCDVPPGTLALRVAEIGPDGRTGPWLSIGLGSPYL
jgi:hypothetical protein